MEKLMLCRCLASTVFLHLLAGSAPAETFKGLLVELTDSKLAILVRAEGEKKADRKTLDMSNKVRVFQIRGDGEKPLPFTEVKKLVKAAGEQRLGLRGILATVTTDDTGQVAAMVYQQISALGAEFSAAQIGAITTSQAQGLTSTVISINRCESA